MWKHVKNIKTAHKPPKGQHQAAGMKKPINTNQIPFSVLREPKERNY
jgi:hypothetical protein